MSTVWINSDNKKIRYKMNYYILYTFWLMTIVPFTIFILWNPCTKYGSKQKYISILTVKKWIIMNFKNLVLKIVCVIILMT